MIKQLYFPQFVYGSIDGIITTFAIISGSLGGNLGRLPIVILGVSNVLADGYSMGVSSYLAEKTDTSRRDAMMTGLVTFISFVTIGILPILPFMFIPDIQIAARVSFTLASILFAIIGYISASVENIKPIYGAIRTLLIGSSAALISYTVGHIIRRNFHI